MQSTFTSVVFPKVFLESVSGATTAKLLCSNKFSFELLSCEESLLF